MNSVLMDVSCAYHNCDRCIKDLSDDDTDDFDDNDDDNADKYVAAMHTCS